MRRMRDLLTPQTRMTREVPTPTPRVLGQNANPVDGKCRVAVRVGGGGTLRRGTAPETLTLNP